MGCPSRGSAGLILRPKSSPSRTGEHRARVRGMCNVLSVCWSCSTGPGQKRHISCCGKNAVTLAFQRALGLQLPPALAAMPHLLFYGLRCVELLACVSCTVVGAILGGQGVRGSRSLGDRSGPGVTRSVCAGVYACSRVWVSLSSGHLLLKTCSSSVLLGPMFLAHVVFTANDFALGVKDSTEGSLPSALYQMPAASASSAF